MKSKMTPLVLASAIMTLAACGGGGDDSPAIGDSPDSPAQGGLITVENYAPLASSIYQLIFIQTGTLPIIPAINLIALQISLDLSRETACEISGTETRTLMGSTDNGVVDAGDSILIEYESCETSSNIQDGFTEITVDRVSGVFGDPGHSASIYFDSNITTSGDQDVDNNGDRVLSYLWTSAESADGLISYDAVNLPRLYSPGSVPVDHPFFDVVTDSLSLDSSVEPEVFMSSVRYPIMAFERIRVESGDMPIETRIWDIDADFSGADELDFSSYTLTPFETRIDSSGEQTVISASGSWEVLMKSGELIRIESTFSDGATVALDLENDGSFEASQNFTWDEFRILFLDSVLDLQI